LGATKIGKRQNQGNQCVQILFFCAINKSSSLQLTLGRETCISSGDAPLSKVRMKFSTETTIQFYNFFHFLFQLCTAPLSSTLFDTVTAALLDFILRDLPVSSFFS